MNVKTVSKSKNPSFFDLLFDSLIKRNRTSFYTLLITHLKTPFLFIREGKMCKGLFKHNEIED